MERFDDRELCREAVQPSTKAPAHAGWRQGMAVFDAAAVRRFMRREDRDGPVECDCLPPQYGVGIRPFSPFFVGGFHG